MESSWHCNAQILGLGSLGIGVCSPLLVAPDIVITNGYPGLRVTDPVAAYGLPNSADAAYFTYVAGKPSERYFPYGYDVQPNVPV